MVIVVVMVGIRGTIKDFTMTYIYFVNYGIDVIKIYRIEKSRYRSTSP